MFNNRAISSHLDTQPLNFQIVPQDIDYFKIPVDRLIGDGFNVQEYNVPIRPSANFTIEDLEDLDPEVKETVIFNVQTGKGKTTLCYKLIEQYAKTGHMVLVLSPFKKLIEKDYAALSVIEGIEVFNYNTIDDNLNLDAYTEDSLEEFVEPFLSKNVQIMTINCLLQNPGEGTERQSFRKRIYLNELFEACRMRGIRVVIFVDEIHESILNFHFDFIPNLLRWHPVVHKCFVSSATFIPASYPVIKFIAMLTGGNIRIYDMPRHKIQSTSGQESHAKLHLHFIDEEYNNGNMHPLVRLNYVLACYDSTYKINILTAYKSFTNTIMNGDDSNSFMSTIQALNPTILTADTINLFNQDGNNIGTNFKTGINMLGDNSVLIIIMPYYENKQTSLGVFSDGIPAIIQSLARIRGKGNIHIFLKKPEFILDKDRLREALPDVFIRDIPRKEHIRQNEGLEKMDFTYSTIRSTRMDTIDWINKKQPQKSDNPGSTFDLSYTYPSYEQYLITDSQDLLVKNYPSFGSDLSSYILWAALNDQFCNAKLHQLTYTTALERVIEYTDENIHTTLGYSLSSTTYETCKQHTFKDSIELLFGQLVYSNVAQIEMDGNIVNRRVLNKFKKGDNSNTVSELKRKSTFIQVLLDLLVNAWSGGSIPRIDKRDYISVCIHNALNRPPDTPCVQPRLISCYAQLDALRTEFYQFVSSNYIPNHEDIPTVHKNLYQSLNDEFVERVTTLYAALRTEDYFIGSTAIPFLNETRRQTGIELKKSIYGQFKRYFTNISSDPVKVGMVQEYYKVVGELAYTISSPLTDLVLLR